MTEGERMLTRSFGSLRYPKLEVTWMQYMAAKRTKGPSRPQLATSGLLEHIGAKERKLHECTRSSVSFEKIRGQFSS